MTDSEKIVRLEKKVAEQDQRLINIEKNGVGLDDQAEQNTKDINRIEDQTINRFEQLINQMNAGFNGLENSLKNDINRVENTLKSDINRVETNLKSDINRVEGQTIKWLSLLIAVAVIIISLLTYFKG